MRYALMLAGTVLVVGLVAEQGFKAAFPPPEPIPPAVINGPFTRPSSKLWVSERQDRERSTRRSNKYVVTNQNDSASQTRRGLPPTSTYRYRVPRYSK